MSVGSNAVEFGSCSVRGETWGKVALRARIRVDFDNHVQAQASTSTIGRTVSIRNYPAAVPGRVSSIAGLTVAVWLAGCTVSDLEQIAVVAARDILGVDDAIGARIGGRPEELISGHRPKHSRFESSQIDANEFASRDAAASLRARFGQVNGSFVAIDG